MAGHGGGGGGHGGSLRGGEGDKKKPSWGVVLRESAALLRQHRGRMLVGLQQMIPGAKELESHRRFPK